MMLAMAFFPWMAAMSAIAHKKGDALASAAVEGSLGWGFFDLCLKRCFALCVGADQVHVLAIFVFPDTTDQTGDCSDGDHRAGEIPIVGCAVDVFDQPLRNLLIIEVTVGTIDIFVERQRDCVDVVAHKMLDRHDGSPIQGDSGDGRPNSSAEGAPTAPAVRTQKGSGVSRSPPKLFRHCCEWRPFRASAPLSGPALAGACRPGWSECRP